MPSILGFVGGLKKSSISSKGFLPLLLVIVSKGLAALFLLVLSKGFSLGSCTLDSKGFSTLLLSFPLLCPLFWLCTLFLGSTPFLEPLSKESLPNGLSLELLKGSFFDFWLWESKGSKTAGMLGMLPKFPVAKGLSAGSFIYGYFTFSVTVDFPKKSMLWLEFLGSNLSKKFEAPMLCLD